MSYRVKVRKRGISTTSTFSKKADADRWANEAETAILNGTSKAADGSIPTLAQATDRYVAEVLPNKSAEEQRKRPAHLQLWRDRFGDKQLTQIIPADIARVRDRWIGEGLVPATVTRRFAALAALFTAAVKQWRILPLSAHPLR